MTEYKQQLDKLRAKLGGDWYDEWWCAAFSWFALHEGGRCRWWVEDYHKEFFNDINSGWLEMYPPEPPKKLTREEYIQQYIVANYD